MNDIRLKINKEINDFFQWNMIWPNELWVGRAEKTELEDYLNSGPISIDNERVFLTEKSNLQLDGLKIRLKDADSYFKIYYNPHY